MKLTKRLVITTALLVSAGAALAATSSPSGVYSGDIHWTNPGVGQQTFTVTATLTDGKLTGIQGAGNPGFVPYNPKKSNATSGCGDANTYTASSSAKYSGHVTRKGLFSFVVRDTYDTLVTLQGRFVSDTKARAHFRFYQGHMPYYHAGKFSRTGHCDSGQLKVVLTKGS
jgi:hypothetical protein